jgi:hypothetical protein
MDSHFVKTADLAKYVQEFINLHGSTYLVRRLAGDKELPDNLTHTTEYIIVSRILKVKNKYTEFNKADKLLIAMNCNHLMAAGDLPVYTLAQIRSEAAQERRSLAEISDQGVGSAKTAAGQPDPFIP